MSLIISEVKQYSLILLDGSFNEEDLTLLAESIDPHKQCLLWMGWAGQHLPENLPKNVRLIRKPLTRVNLSSACEQGLSIV
jgi:hypothetical protein